MVQEGQRSGSRSNFWRAAVDIRHVEARLYRVQQKANKTDYQSMVFVCVSNNRVDVVNQLLIQIYK